MIRLHKSPVIIKPTLPKTGTPQEIATALANMLRTDARLRGQVNAAHRSGAVIIVDAERTPIAEAFVAMLEAYMTALSNAAAATATASAEPVATATASAEPVPAALATPVEA